MRPVKVAVEDPDAGSARFEEADGDGSRRTSGPEEGDAGKAGRRPVGTAPSMQALDEMGDEAEGIGVVAAQAAIRLHDQGVDGSDALGPGRQTIHEAKRSFLVRDGDVAAGVA